MKVLFLYYYRPEQEQFSFIFFLLNNKHLFIQVINMDMQRVQVFGVIVLSGPTNNAEMKHYILKSQL